MTPPPVLGSSGYNADFDLDRDGIVSSKDVRFVQDQVGRAAVGDSISDHSVTDPSNYSSPPSGPNNILGFAGMVQGRPSTGLLLARHRWLDPKLGRWLTRDPAGYVDGLNLFEYCGSGPAVRVDHSGLIFFGLIGDAEYEAAQNWIQQKATGIGGTAGIAAGTFATLQLQIINTVDSVADPARLTKSVIGGIRRGIAAEDNYAKRFGTRPTLLDQAGSVVGELTGANNLSAGVYGCSNAENRTLTG